jgi:hypothetical protein
MTCCRAEIRKVDSDDGSDGHVETAWKQVDTVSVDDGLMTGDGNSPRTATGARIT